jgi:beta-galactosidase
MSDGGHGFSDLTAELGICFGGDYNPEQWPREVWAEDASLMQRAGVNLVTVGVFSWARIEPEPGARDFGWLDEVLELLHAHGIAVDLATPTASPPPWLGHEHPETLPVDRDGVRLVAGSRNQFAPASAAYRQAARTITRDLAERYRGHPAVRMWHVGNEFGQLDYGEEAAGDFRQWLRRRYDTIEELNEVWATAVWSQRYRSFDEILPPRRMPYVVNPTQSVDFRRYTSDALLRCYAEQRDEIRAAGARQPITTNFMGFFAHADYWSWADELDVISDDQYPDPASRDAPADIALVQDLMRSLGHGRPWMLMEQAAGAVSWREHNVPKTPEQLRLFSLQAVARGADGICFFQWRQARTGQERFHSAMLPHAGADTEGFAGVERLGAELRRLKPVVGGRVDARVGILFDWPSWWAGEEPARPTERLETLEQLRRWHRALWRRGVAADIVRPASDLSGYSVVLVPHSYVIEPDAAASLRACVAMGAHLVLGPFSGVADGNGHILQGRSPALLRDVMGVSGEEWVALPDEPTPLAMAGGAGLVAESQVAGMTAAILGERLRAEDAEVLATFGAGALSGLPAVTRNAFGDGTATYLGAVVCDGLLHGVIDAALRDAHVRGALSSDGAFMATGTQGSADGPGGPGSADRPGSADAGVLPDGVEAVRRGPALFLLNHGSSGATVALAAGMHDLLTDEDVDLAVALPPGGARVLIERLTT